MTDLRIFSYLPNPRIWKATIAARLCLQPRQRDGRRRRVELAGDAHELLNDHERPLVERRRDPRTRSSRRYRAALVLLAPPVFFT